jgi:hypothetical protein
MKATVASPIAPLSRATSSNPIEIQDNVAVTTPNSHKRQDRCIGVGEEHRIPVLSWKLSKNIRVWRHIVPQGDDQSSGSTEANEESLHAAIKPMCSDGNEKTFGLVAPPQMGISGPTAVTTWAPLQRALCYVCFVDSHAEGHTQKMSTVTLREQVNASCCDRGQSGSASLSGMPFCDPYGRMPVSITGCKLM